MDCSVQCTYQHAWEKTLSENNAYLTYTKPKGQVNVTNDKETHELQSKRGITCFFKLSVIDRSTLDGTYVSPVPRA